MGRSSGVWGVSVRAGRPASSAIQQPGPTHQLCHRLLIRAPIPRRARPRSAGIPGPSARPTSKGPRRPTWAPHPFGPRITPARPAARLKYSQMSIKGSGGHQSGGWGWVGWGWEMLALEVGPGWHSWTLHTPGPLSRWVGGWVGR